MLFSEVTYARTLISSSPSLPGWHVASDVDDNLYSILTFRWFWSNLAQNKWAWSARCTEIGLSPGDIPILSRRLPPPRSRIRSGVQVSASFQKLSRLVGRLGSGPRLVGRLGLRPRLVGRSGSGSRLVGQLGSAVRASASYSDQFFF